MDIRRFHVASAGMFLATCTLLVGCPASDNSPSAEEAAPEVAAACRQLDEDLAALAERTETAEANRDFAVEVFDAVSHARDELRIETEIGFASDVLGMHSLFLSSTSVVSGYGNRGIGADTTRLRSEFSTRLAGLEAGAGEFGLDGCVDSESASEPFNFILDGLDALTAETNPTGVFADDFAAACTRFSADIIQVTLSQSDENAQFLTPSRLGQAFQRMSDDIERLVPPDEFAELTDRLLTALDDARSSALALGQPQRDVGEARADYERAVELVEKRLEAIDPDC